MGDNQHLRMAFGFDQTNAGMCINENQYDQEEAMFLFLPLSALATTAVSWLAGVYSFSWFVGIFAIFVGGRVFIRNHVTITDRDEK